jgi:hypothetical protein
MVADVPQQTGVLFMQQQQTQPAAIMVAMQSQQAWIILQHCSSPDVQVMTHPSLLMSHLHMPMVRLQQQTIMPFIMQHSEHMPPWSIMQRFCIMLHAIGSSQEQVIFIPPVHFSMVMVQRGTMSMLGIIGAAVPPIGDAPIVGMPMPGIPIPVRSIIIVLAIDPYSLRSRDVWGVVRPSAVPRLMSGGDLTCWVEGLQRFCRFCGGFRLRRMLARASPSAAPVRDIAIY